MIIKVLTVSNLNNYIKKSFDNDYILNNISVKGEISNIKLHSSGHMYFSLKDENSKVNCVMFRSYVPYVDFTPKNGDKVILKGKISVYEKEGTYQLYCNEMKLDGIGELFINFEKLKNQLNNKGLFEEIHKKSIPLYSKKIGVITSPTGAAIKDIINVSKRRNPNVDILIYPSLVQGEYAAENLIKGIKVLNSIPDIDVIILARGGGSIEELWAFNNEDLAYEIFNSSKPIITGIGHETDFTIADFVSDRRASTPSAAAEIAVCNLDDINKLLLNYKSLLINRINSYYNFQLAKINEINHRLKLYSPENYIVNQYKYIDNLRNTVKNKLDLKLSIEKEKLSKHYSLLNAHNPLNVLSKGYSIIEDEKGNIISEVKSLSNAINTTVTLKDGKVRAKINVLEEL